MDVEITTSDPDQIDAEEIFEALQALGYFVDEITVVGREQ